MRVVGSLLIVFSLSGCLPKFCSCSNDNVNLRLAGGPPVASDTGGGPMRILSMAAGTKFEMTFEVTNATRETRVLQMEAQSDDCDLVDPAACKGPLESGASCTFKVACEAPVMSLEVTMSIDAGGAPLLNFVSDP